MLGDSEKCGVEISGSDSTERNEDREGITDALATCSSDRLELADEEDGFDFDVRRAGNGGTRPTSSFPELEPDALVLAWTDPFGIGFAGLVLRVRDELAVLSTCNTLSFSSCSSAFFIVCATFDAWSD